MKVPRTVEIAKDALAANKCVVIGLQTTGEARLKDALKSGCDLEEFAGMKETVKCARWKQIFRRPPTLPIPPQPLPPLSHAIAPLPSRTFPTCLCEPPACVHRFLLGKFPTGDYLGMHTEDDSDAEGESDEDDDMGRVNHSTAARNAKSKASGRRGEVVSDDDDDDDDMAGFIVNSDDEEYAEVLSCATATAQSLATQRLPIETSRARSAVSQRLTPPTPYPLCVGQDSEYELDGDEEGQVRLSAEVRKLSKGQLRTLLRLAKMPDQQCASWIRTRGGPGCVGSIASHGFALSWVRHNPALRSSLDVALTLRSDCCLAGARAGRTCSLASRRWRCVRKTVAARASIS